MHVPSFHNACEVNVDNSVLYHSISFFLNVFFFFFNHWVVVVISNYANL